MRVAVAHEIGQPLEVEDVEIGPLGPRDVLVRVAASGMCHTDLSVVEGLTASPIPTVPGHEGCGVVEEVGTEVRRVRTGDRVRTSVSPACGSCWWCLNGMSNHCEMGPVVRSVPRWRLRNRRTAASVCGCGTFSEATVVDEASVVAIHTDLPDEQLALIGCGVTTGVGAALNTAGVVPGSSVAVIGCGGVGQSVIQGARIAGAVTIVGVDPSSERRQASLAVGATDVVDPAETDPVDRVRSLTAGRGVDYSFEVVGRPELIVQAVDMARVEGAVTLVGMPPVDATVTLAAVPTIFSGKRVQGSAVGGSQILRDFPRYVRLAEAGKLNLASLLSRRIKLDEVNDGMNALRQAEGIRTVIV
jgi:S-(hydroxymethyl)glutathione dehydrogenase / alcohol dehydrogenase